MTTYTTNIHMVCLYLSKRVQVTQLPYVEHSISS